MDRTKILIVEDEAVIAMYVQNSLAKLGYEVCATVNSGEEAVRKATELRPDLVLMDIVLQGDMDGIQAAKIIHETLDIPVVYMTGNADVPTIQRARDTAPYGYVLKPVNVMHLFSTIDAILRRRDLEVRLSESEEKFRAISENIVEGVSLTIDFKNAWVNQSFADIFGYSPEEMIGRGADQVIHPDDLPELLRRGRGLMGGESHGYFRTRALRKQGGVIIIDVKGRIFKLRESMAILLIVRDVTESVRIEAALRESEEKYRNLVDDVNDVIFALDEKGVITFISPSVENQTGYTERDLLGRSMIDIVYPEDRKLVIESFTSRKDGSPGMNEGRIVTKSGKPLWFQVSGKPIMANGVFKGLRGVASNIDEKKRAAEALRASEERFRSMATNMPGVLYQLTVDADSVVHVNYIGDRCHDLFGLEKNPVDTFFQRGSMYIHPDDMKSWVESFNTAVKNEAEWDFEGRYNNPGGNQMWLKIVGQPMRKDGRLMYNGIAFDITERKLAEMKFRESEDRFRALVQNLQDIIIILDIDGKVVFENPSTAATLGWSMVGEIAFNAVHPDDATEARRAFKDVVKRVNDDTPIQLRMRHADGSWLDMEVLAVNLFDDASVRGMLVVCRDITLRMRAQRELRESEERFRALVQNLQDIILVVDSKGVVKFENPATAAILGYQALGMSIFDVVHPDDIASAINDFREVIDKTNPHNPSLFRVRHLEDSWLYVEVLATNLFDDPVIQGMMIVCKDVTSRMKAQQALRDSEERYRALFDQSPVGVVHFNRDLILTDCNETLAKIMNSSREKLIGLDLHQLRQEELLEKLNETIAGSFISYEGPYLAMTTSAAPLLAVTASPLRDENGVVVGGMAVIQDVTARKMAEEHLKLSEERNRLLVENANEGIAVIQDWRFVFANPRLVDITGYSAEELSSRRFTEFIHPDDREMISGRYRKRMEGDTAPFTYEVRFIHRAGETRWTEINSVLFDWEGKPAVLLFIRDVTERKEAEEERRKIESQIQQTQKLESLGVLAGGIAHDFNNLLMTILGNLDLALLDLATSSPVRSNLIEAAKSSQRAADLCRQMLAYSGKGRFTSEPLSLNELVEDMAHMLELSISKKSIVRYKLSPGIPAIEADATQVRQIIMNLVINASDAIGEKSGIISVSTGVMECDRAYLSETWLNERLPEGRYVYVEVADTGAGMTKDTLPRIFDPFFTTKFTGRGLGLAAVLGIVRGHRGAIKIYSEPGKGTTFKILFPAVERPAGHLDEAWKEARGWRGSGTVILADDEDTIRAIGKQMLERLGFTVRTASNGNEVMDIFRELGGKVACVILDMTMPHMDGEETFRALRRAKKNVRVVMSSGYNEQEVTQRFVGKGLAGFIQKPYKLADLAAKLKEILG